MGRLDFRVSILGVVWCSILVGWVVLRMMVAVRGGLGCVGGGFKWWRKRTTFEDLIEVVEFEFKKMMK